MGKQFTHIELHNSGRYDPTKTRMLCERAGCSREFVVADSVSFVTTIALSGDVARYSAQCPEEQHFCCSWECAEAMHLTCVREHLRPLHDDMLAKVQAARTPGV